MSLNHLNEWKVIGMHSFYPLSSRYISVRNVTLYQIGIFLFWKR